MNGWAGTPWAAMIVAGVVLTLAGGLLAWWGRRGRRVGDHPHCRRCEYDLYGLPAATERCPECGASIAAPEAQRIGLRHRRPRAVAGGVLLLLLGLTLSGLGGRAVARGADVQQYKPLWWLCREAASVHLPTHQAAMKELSRRMKAGQLTIRDQVQVALIPPLKGTPNDTIPSLSVDCALASRAAGQLSDAQWDTVARRMTPWSLATSRMVRRRGPFVPIEIRTPIGGYASAVSTDFDLSVQSVRVDGIEVPCPDIRWSHRGLPNHGRSSGTDRARVQVPWELSPGIHELTCVAQISVQIGDRVTGPVVQWSQDLSLRDTFEVIAVAPEDEARLNTDPALRQAVRESLQPDRKVPPDGDNVRLGGASRPTPVALVLDVCLRDGKKEASIGTLVVLKDQAMKLKIPRRWRGVPPAPCQLVLRPNPFRSRGRSDIDEIWGEEIVFEPHEWCDVFPELPAGQP